MYLQQSFYGHTRKGLTEDMVCFQQAATAFLLYYKQNNMHMPWKKKQLQEDGDEELTKFELRLQKYLDRMYLIAQNKHEKYKALSEDAIFQELDKVIACQLNLEVPAGILPRDDDWSKAPKNPITNIPLVDVILNIDFFTTTHEDREKILRIVKEMFNHCTTMKKLLLKHHKLILNVLIQKYDK